MPPTHDLLIRDADVIDGSGAPRFRADVAVAGERIAAVLRHDVHDARARAALRGALEIDALGRVLAPGFIDVHTHDDTALIAQPAMAMKASQGVTTVICGNCGASAAPVLRPEVASDLLSLIVRDPSHAAPDFTSFAAKVEAARPALNAAFLIGHSTLRASVMGDDLARPATDDEIERMRTLLDACLAQGAIGMSSGLFYPPAAAATADEVARVAEPLGRWGGLYTAHMRDEGDAVLAAMDETFGIGRRAGAAVVVSHHKCAGRANFGRMRETLPRMDAARAAQPVAFDVYPYTASSTILRPEMIDRAERVLVTWSDRVDGVAGRDLAQIAAEWGVDAHEAARRLQPAGAIYFTMDEADVQAALAHPAAMVGSDGLPFDAHPHPRLWGTFPRVLGHYCRGLRLFPLEDAVHRMTGLSASTFGLADRGFLRPGLFADLCLFDPETVLDRADFADPCQPATGIDTVIVNGRPVWRGGAPTGERPGRVLRRTGPRRDAPAPG
jgi:N-acyl-D-amino-acid deacylase